MILSGRNIIVGISGGIAAYKALHLISLLRKNNANVRVILTKAGREFVTPLSARALSGQPVYEDEWQPEADNGMDHIALAKWADTIIIAPATANVLAKQCSGITDDLLSSVCAAYVGTLYLAPAMNQAMWQQASTIENVKTLQTRGAVILGPESGSQACGDVGPGRMSEPENIIAALTKENHLLPLFGKRVVITAGPTREMIDPARFISNPSSGKMGYALAQSALLAGADVTLISGPVNIEAPPGLLLIPVTSAMEMHQAVIDNIANTDIFISAAAVCDYRPEQTHLTKQEKQSGPLTLTLVPNPDILLEVSGRQDKPYCVGFAAQSHDVAEKALAKMSRKNLDLIIANDISRDDIGFHSDENEVTVFYQGGEKHFNKTSKNRLASQLIQFITEQTCKKFKSK